jgi:ERF superfamily
MNENIQITAEQAELNKSLIKALAETKDIHADDYNPYHKSKFASLSAHLSVLKPIFAKHSLGILQMPVSHAYEGTSVGVRTIILHANGASIETSCYVPVTAETTGQQAGSLITYLRRYALASLAGVSTDDCDAETDRIVKTATVKPQSTSTTKWVPNETMQAPKPISQVVASVISDITGDITGDIDPNMPVPFGNNKGTPISDLKLNDLKYWATVWQPRPFEKTGKVSVKDAKLKRTAEALWANTNSPSQPDETVDEVPF